MASTYSQNLKLQLMTTGENNTTWGVVTNVNLGTSLEEAIVGSADVEFDSTNVVLSLSSSNASQAARNLRLNLIGTTGGSTRALQVPDIKKVYIIQNNCSNNIEVKNSIGANVSIPPSKTMWVYSTGTGVISPVNHLNTLSLGTTPSPVVTEVSAQTLLNKTLEAANLGANTFATTQSLGDNSTKIATTAYVDANINASGLPTGVILMWSGSIATIPAGFAFCDGTNGTPDLRDRFIVGTGLSYGVAATGGSADAVVVEHTHVATVTDPGHRHTISPNSNWSQQDGIRSSWTPQLGGSSNTSTVKTGVTVKNSFEGESGENKNLPPYYALAYIMKL